MGNRVVGGVTPSVPKVGIFKESMGARNRGGIGLSYRPVRLHRLAEFIPRNQFQGHINIEIYGLNPVYSMCFDRYLKTT